MKQNKHKEFSRRPAETAGKEIEVKLRVADRSALRRRLIRLRAKVQGCRVHEMNTLYDTPQDVLRSAGRMLRLRVQRPASGAGKARKTPNAKKTAHGGPPTVWLTYKGPEQPNATGGAAEGPSYKVREERESRVTDGDAIAEIIEGIGLGPSFRYEKYRSTFWLPGLPGLKVQLDETPIGDFLELEGGRETIDRAARLLGFGPADYITRSYGALYLEYALKRPAGQGRAEPLPVRDMLFSRAR